mmetsp:Transcript_23478/g.72223  ORF Transcript_23478/g.72223 Transcript_23478/m.72223 type:complete len:114 (-) Transcript_23478:437-778(-)
MMTSTTSSDEFRAALRRWKESPRELDALPLGRPRRAPTESASRHQRNADFIDLFRALPWMRALSAARGPRRAPGRPTPATPRAASTSRPSASLASCLLAKPDGRDTRLTPEAR